MTEEGSAATMSAENSPVPVPLIRRSSCRRFVLDRKVDISGNSGTGIVAEGVMFTGGRVVLTWFSHFNSITVFDSMEAMKKLHGHGAHTVVVWVDEEQF